jgi:hypothetical protein
MRGREARRGKQRRGREGGGGGAAREGGTGGGGGKRSNAFNVSGYNVGTMCVGTMCVGTYLSCFIVNHRALEEVERKDREYVNNHHSKDGRHRQLLDRVGDCFDDL